MKMRKLYLAIDIFSLFASSLASSDDIWSTLNNTVNGRLHKATPYAFPCFSSYNGQPKGVDEAACSAIRSNYVNASARAEVFSGLMNIQSEACLSNATDQCLLDSTIKPSPEPGTGQSCNQGSVADYYVQVEEASDVVSVFQFARRHSMSLSIKNSGHDYMTRNSLKGSLALWVRKLEGLEFLPEFQPEGSPEGAATASQRAVRVGAGVRMHDLYSFAESNNVTFVGGYASTIGPSGGWVQGGGHSVLSPVYGLGVDRVLQYRVVTPDGSVRIANSYQNADLFWALRGGGGGTFGVVLESVHRVEPRIPIAVASIRLPATSSRQVRNDWLSIVVNSSLAWGNDGWGGHVQSTWLIDMSPILNLSAAQASMKAASDFALANNGTSVVEVLPSWYDVYTKYVVSSQAAVGQGRIIVSRLIPTELFSDDIGRENVTEYLQHMLDIGLDPYVVVDTPLLYKGDVQATSVSPAWRSSLWSLSGGRSITWNSTDTERLELLKNSTTLTLRAEQLTGPQGGAYVNEANPFTPEWKQAWWGEENYGKLLKIKKKYDPHGLLNCWKCVGFEEETATTGPFACMGKLQQAINDALKTA